MDKVASGLDVVVIGVGGLTAAAVLAKLGKKVLVLEQHDKAGGLCQSFTVKGFQFDTAFHYIGQLHENSLLRIALDQITDGQLQFAELDPQTDTVVIGRGGGHREYTIYTGKRQMEAHLKKQFPNGTWAIEEFFKIMKVFHSILVKAPVSQILVNNNGAAYGVTVQRGSEQINIKAPVVISSVGVFTTFQELLPYEIQVKSEVKERLSPFKIGKGSFQVFAGFNAAQEELGITSTNTLLFKSNDLDDLLEEYFSLNKDKAPENVPMMFVSFPSAKDPTSKDRFPGKSCMEIHTIVRYEWFAQWKDLPVETLADHENYKMRFANYLFDWACSYFPKLRAKLAVLHAVSPVNMHGLGAKDGSMMSAEHNLE
ncbi:hypothetical protein SRHO_G00184580 [Serrasalmus rhombeus]